MEYGLSCDDAHPGMLTLKGVIYYKSLKQFDAARECFELALFHDPFYVEAYHAYTSFLVKMDELGKAARLIKTAYTVKGIDKARIYYVEAQIFEKKQEYRKALDNLAMAKQYSYGTESTFYEEAHDKMQAREQISLKRKSAVHIIIK